MRIGKKILEVRTKKKLSRRQLSELSGVSETAIKQYENESRQPRLGQLTAIAKALDCTASDFLEEGDWATIDKSDAFDDYPFAAAKKNEATADADPQFTYALQNETKTLTDADKALLLSMAKQLNAARRDKEQK